eukprot:gene28054-49834_t
MRTALNSLMSCWRGLALSLAGIAALAALPRAAASARAVAKKNARRQMPPAATIHRRAPAKRGSGRRAP